MVREAKDRYVLVRLTGVVHAHITSQNSKRKVENKIQRLIFSVSSWDE